MNKLIKTSGIILCAALLIMATIIFGACGEKSEYLRWNLTDDGSVTAAFSDNGKYGFILTIDGEGEMPDYASEKDAPWYSKSGRVTEIVISEGITYIGDNAFTHCAAETVVIPRTVTEIGHNSFSADIRICAYSQVKAEEGTTIYLYSESKPSGGGYYWRFKDGVATVWDTIKVLFIGNSFTYYSDMPELFENIANAAGENVVAESITQGAWTLTKFADPNDEYGKLVEVALNSSSDYDVVVLQEQSTRPLTNYKAFVDAAETLKSKIERTQEDCSIYLYSTWGYAEAAESRNVTIPELEAQIRAAYESAAKELGVGVCHVGKAFSKVYEENKDINLYYSDNKHPSYEGAFLSACVHAATILNCDPTKSTFIGQLEESVAAQLKEVARAVVYGG